MVDGSVYWPLDPDGRSLLFGTCAATSFGPSCGRWPTYGETRPHTKRSTSVTPIPVMIAAAMDGLDSQILLDQILGQFDSVTREMILRRIEGHSWGEIASEFGLSNHAARVRFSKALQWLRSSVETARKGSVKSTSPSTRKYHRVRDRKAQRVAAFERRLDRMLTPAFYREFHQLLRATKTAGAR